MPGRVTLAQDSPDSPASAPVPLPVDTKAVARIRASPWPMLGLTLFGGLMTALFAAIAFDMFANPVVDLRLQLAGQIGLAVCAFATVVVAWRALVALCRPVITLSPTGLRDIRLAREEIPWSAIRHITAWSQGGEHSVMLLVEPGIPAKLTFTPIARFRRSTNRALGTNALYIPMQGLAADLDKLLALTMAYAAAHKAPSAAAAGPALRIAAVRPA